MGGTPSTRITSFSPEDCRDKSFNLVKSTTSNLGHDPFVGPSFKPKPEAKLSATATSFEPYGLGFSSHPSAKLMTSMAPIPGTAQYLKSIIAAEEKSPNRQQVSSTSEVTKMGYFTTETLASRHLKVASFFKEDIRSQVQQSIEVSSPISLLHTSPP